MGWKALLEIRTQDEELARRGRLLNILLLGFAVASLLMLGASLFAQFVLHRYQINDLLLIYVSAPVLLAGFLLIYLLNRSGRQVWASYVFLLVMVLAFTFSDAPQEVIDGRSTAMHFIPIIMAGMLLEPYSGFVVASIETASFLAISISIDYDPNLVGIVSFYIVALIGWLSSSSLKRALNDLRAINRELDQRVEERTRELAEALGRNQAILEGIADGVIVFDNNDHAVVANPAVTGLLGRTPAEIVGSDIGALMGEAVGVPDQEQVTELLHDREKRFPSIRLPWGHKTLSVSAAPVRDVSDQIMGTVAVFRDFTREAEVERMKSAFVSMVSHELRTPLGGIIGYSEMLKESFYGALSESQGGAVDRIMYNARELLGLVNDLLDRARIEAGRLDLEISPFSPRELVDDVTATMVVLARNKGLDLTSHVANDVPDEVVGDRQRVQQILINLAGNAVKFTDRGEVQIRAYRPDANHWALAVADTGPGIPLDAQAYVFEAFRQVDGSATRTHGGAGLGLSIVRQLAELMGGDIKLTSRVGRGSIFTVMLPVVAANQMEEEPG
jgi:PAS domain S-box-containing protein